tara:strand:- start:29 stop:502 length:474 start_codon:yes stop_codon:yes gene_type:complete
MANELYTQVLKNTGREAVIHIYHNGNNDEAIITGGYVQGVVDGTGVTGDPGTVHLVTGYRFDTSDAANITKVFDDYPKRIKKVQYGHQDNTALTILKFEDNTGNSFEIFEMGGNGEVTFPLQGIPSPLTGGSYSLVVDGSNDTRVLIITLVSDEQQG